MTLCAAGLIAVLSGRLDAQNYPGSGNATGDTQIAALRAQVADQQKQIDQLKLAVEEQRKLIERSPSAAASGERKIAPPASGRMPGEVASTTPILPVAAAPISATAAVLPSAAISAAQPPAAAPSNPCDANPEGPAPAFIRLGSTCLVPVGFMDMTAIWRDKNAASSIGTNFGSIPFNNVANGKISEFRFSPQNSRLGFRVDGNWKGAHFIGYNEFDFLGTGGATNYTVTNGAFVPRLRLYWVDVRKGAWEVLGGQSWSMLTPNRTGISALPGNLFYTQVIDVNYMAGLTWTRQTGMRVLYHPSNKVTFGFSAENPDQYIGGSGGGSVITLPAAFAVLAGTQLDNSPNIGVANTVLTAPTLHPDFIAKVAFDPSSRFHAEVTGIERSFKIINPNNLVQGEYHTTAGGGIQVGLNGEIIKNWRLVSTNYWSDGGGRYLFGNAPDLIVRANGDLSLVHAGGTIDGIETRFRNWQFYAYYGGIYIGRNTAIDANGAKVGYGGPGASQNRAINEITFGWNQTLWANPRYGAVNSMFQYEWLDRRPWFVAANAPKGTHDNTIYFNLRYTLPGSMPNFQ